MRRIRRIVKSERGIYEVARNEEDVVREIMDLLAWNKIDCWRSVERIPKRGKRGQVVGRFQTPGLPDITGLAVGGKEGPGSTRYALPFWIEAKGPSGRLRPSQERFLTLYRGVGLCAFMARSWNEVKAELRKWGVEIKVE